MASGALTTYLGYGDIGDRPATPDTFAGIPSFYFATDTGVLSIWDGSVWTDSFNDSVTIIIESTTARTITTADSGAHTIINCTNAGATSITFDNTESYNEGNVFNIRASGAGGITLVESGVTLTPPKGGSLLLAQDDTVSVIMTSGTAGFIAGSTEAP